MPLQLTRKHVQVITGLSKDARISQSSRRLIAQLQADARLDIEVYTARVFADLQHSVDNVRQASQLIIGAQLGSDVSVTARESTGAQAKPSSFRESEMVESMTLDANTVYGQDDEDDAPTAYVEESPTKTESTE